jgi:hypothetical protein
MAIRTQLRRTRGRRKPDHTLVVSRPSYFGNPYWVGIKARDNAEALFERDLEVARRNDLTPERLDVWRSNRRLGAEGPFWIINNIHRSAGWSMGVLA